MAWCVRLMWLASGGDPTTGLARRGWVLMFLLVVIGFMLVGGTFLLMVLRRSRRRREEQSGRTRTRELPDPWLEAGRRAEPETRQIPLNLGENPPDTQTPPDAAGVPGTAAFRNAQNWPGGQRPVAMITGGAKRVGRAIAEVFAAAGYDLILTYHTSFDAARRAADELCGRGVAVHLAQMDLDDLGAVERTAGELARELPRLDVLVHNASVYGPTPIDSLTAAEAMMHYRVNAAAPLILSKQLAVKLAASPRPGGGAIVAMTDIHAMGRPRAGFSAYSMSKAAVVELVRTLARELAPRVRVNAVAPGVVVWPESGADSTAAEQADYVARVPLQRSGTPEEAAETVRWLAVDATYVTGQILRLDGGRSLN